MEEAACRPLTSPFDIGRIWSGARQKQIILFFIALGLLARCVRYFLCFPLWEDECFLCSNFIGRDYLELLSPLNYHQVAPVLFLWLELGVTHLLGFSEFSLRLFPFLASVASLFLFWHLARRLLDGPALILAIAIFAVAYPCIRYAAEAKPYGTDLFVSLILYTLAIEWWRNPQQLRWLWALTGCLPVAVGLSYPTLFSAGGISLFVAYQLLVQFRRISQSTAPDFFRKASIAWIAYNAVLMACFAGIYGLTIHTQSAAELTWMRECWKDSFPPLTSATEFLRWLALTHTSDLLAYPVGGEKGASLVTALCFFAGIAVLVYRKKLGWLLFLLAPLALHFLAALLQRYPYGVHFKYSQYVAPLLCLLAGFGLAAWISLLARADLTRRRALQFWLALLLLIGGGSIARDILYPYKSTNDMRARAFARWFWFNAAHDSEAVCMKTDLNLDFSPQTFRELSWSAMYLCNQHIYSPRHRRGAAPNWGNVSAKKALRIVHYKALSFPYDSAAFQRWLEGTKSEYRLVSTERFPFPCYNKRATKLINMDYIEMYTFVPATNDPTITAVQHSTKAR